MTELTDLSETDASNTTITTIDIGEGCAPSGINNAIRNTLGLIRRAFKSSIFRLRDETDQTKLLAFNLSGITTATTRTLTVPDISGGLVLDTGAQTIAGLKDFTTNPKVSGGGLQFPATQVPSTDVNCLDDYKEDTFTPTVYGTSVTGAGTYSTQIGVYTKIGRVVFFTIELNWTAHTGSGNMNIAGLPFTAASNSPCAFQVSDITFPNALQAVVASGTTNILLFSYATGASQASITLDTSGVLRISGQYIV